MLKKLKKNWINLKYRLSETLQWNKRRFSLKYPFLLNRVTKIILSIFGIVFCCTIFILFLYKTRILIFQDNSFYLDLNKRFDNINISGIITSQISTTMLILSITSLIASTEKKYILGKKAIEIVFPKNPINTFSLYLFLLFVLAFLNIYFLINQFGDSLIILDFVVSILMVAYFVYRFATVFVNPQSIKKNLEYKYYRDNIRHIKKSKPLSKHVSKSTESFKNVTIRYIREGNIPIYTENIDSYFLLLETTLYNNKKLVQNYYTDGSIHYDLISHIADFSQELLEANRIKESLELYNRLYDKLNYYQIINISDIVINYMSSKFIERIKLLSSETEINEYSGLVNHMIGNLQHQIYLYSKADLSYCRLYTHNMIFMWADNSLYERYYLSIYENPYLSKIEKSRLYEKLFDDIRMEESNRRLTTYNIEDFNQKNRIHKEKDVYPTEIKAEPIALMILKMFENKDYENIKLFLNNHLSDRLKFAIKSFVILSITQAIIRGKRTYRMDLNIEEKFSVNALKHSHSFSMTCSIEDLISLYQLINEKYTIGESSKSYSGSYYAFHPKFSFSKDIVDTYFLFISKIIHQMDQFTEKIATTIKSDQSVENVIKKYTNNS